MFFVNIVWDVLSFFLDRIYNLNVDNSTILLIVILFNFISIYKINKFHEKIVINLITYHEDENEEEVESDLSSYENESEEGDDNIPHAYWTNKGDDTNIFIENDDEEIPRLYYRGGDILHAKREAERSASLD
jgi:hypothetical protein